MEWLNTAQKKILALLAAVGLGAGVGVTLTQDGCQVRQLPHEEAGEGEVEVTE